MNRPTFNFTTSFNQHPSNLRAIARLRAQAEYMYLTPMVKAHFTIVTFTVECDTPHERRILEDLSRGL